MPRKIVLYVCFYINTVTDVGVVISQSDYIMDLTTNMLYALSDHITHKQNIIC